MKRLRLMDPRALWSFACLLIGLASGCQSPLPTGTRATGAPPRVIPPDGDWHFKAYRTANPTSRPTALPTLPSPRGASERD